jgi:hypothetical protein
VHVCAKHPLNAPALNHMYNIWTKQPLLGIFEKLLLPVEELTKIDYNTDGGGINCNAVR